MFVTPLKESLGAFSSSLLTYSLDRLNQSEVIPMSSLFMKLKIEPGARVNLGNIDPSYRRFHLHEVALPEIQPRIPMTDQLQLPDLHEEFLVEAGEQGEVGGDRSGLPGTGTSRVTRPWRKAWL